MINTRWLATVILLLTFCIGQMRAAVPTLSDLDFGDPDFTEDFESVEGTPSKSNSSTAWTSTTLTGYGEFTHAYLGKNNNGTQSIAVKAASSPMTSKYFELVATSNLAGVSFSRTFGTKGAFSFKIAKSSITSVGLYAAVANSSFAHASASVYVKSNNGTIQMSSGSSWTTVSSSLPSTDVLDITVIYNNTNSNTTYGDGISLNSKRAHVYINGNAVPNAGNTAPKDFTIPGATLTAFRIHYNASGTGKVDDIKIYDNLPVAAAVDCEATPTVGAASLNGSFFWTPNFCPLVPDKYRSKAIFSYLHYVKDRLSDFSDQVL